MRRSSGRECSANNEALPLLRIGRERARVVAPLDVEDLLEVLPGGRNPATDFRSGGGEGSSGFSLAARLDSGIFAENQADVRRK
jgi:hypothetical protein